MGEPGALVVARRRMRASSTLAPSGLVGSSATTRRATWPETRVLALSCVTYVYSCQASGAADASRTASESESRAKRKRVFISKRGQGGQVRVERAGEFVRELFVGQVDRRGMGGLGEEDFVPAGGEDKKDAGGHSPGGIGVPDFAATSEQQGGGGAVLVVAFAQGGLCDRLRPGAREKSDGAEQATAFAIGAD